MAESVAVASRPRQIVSAPGPSGLSRRGFAAVRPLVLPLQARIAIRFGSALHGRGNPGSSHGEWVVMDNLRWWLLLIAAVMFSMSGCASARDVVAPATGDDRVVSVRDGGDEAVHDQGTEEPAMDLSGRWVGTWRDETQGLFTALKPFPGGILQALSSDGHPPLYFFFLHFWAHDDAEKLARGLRAAIDKTASVSPSTTGGK